MFFSKKPQVAHIRLNGVIGNVGRFQQGMSFNSHEQIIKKAFTAKITPFKNVGKKNIKIPEKPLNPKESTLTH